jgi:hypothetical protein
VAIFTKFDDLITSDVQGFVNPPRVKGRGQQGKGQGFFRGSYFSNIKVLWMLYAYKIKFKQY